MSRLSSFEYDRRIWHEVFLEHSKNTNAVFSVENKEEIRKQAFEEFERKLDSKLKNLQEGEYLSIVIEIDILQSNGKVRGGSGAQRNMPEYIDWRSSVFERDSYECQNCGSSKDIQAHHIKAWSGHPSLRFDLENGITLCRKCHADIHPHINFFDT